MTAGDQSARRNARRLRPYGYPPSDFLLRRFGDIGGLGRVENLEDFAGDVPLEATKDLGFAKALGRSTGDVGAGSWIATETHQSDDPERAIGITVSATIQPAEQQRATNAVG